MDIEQVETWDDLFNLPSEITPLLQALERRALNPLKRYRDLPEDKANRFRPDLDENPGIVRKLVDAAEKSSRLRLHEITAMDEAPTTCPSVDVSSDA